MPIPRHWVPYLPRDDSLCAIGPWSGGIVAGPHMNLEQRERIYWLVSRAYSIHHSYSDAVRAYVIAVARKYSK